MATLYEQQKGLTPKATLSQTTMLEGLLKDYLKIDFYLSGISKKDYNTIYALFFQKDYTGIKKIINNLQ